MGMMVGYIALAFLGVPNAEHREKVRNGPNAGETGYIAPTFLDGPNAHHREKIRSGPHVDKMATQPLPSRGSPMRGTGRKSEVAHMWAKWLHSPCLFVGNTEIKSKVALGQNGYITRAFSGC